MKQLILILFFTTTSLFCQTTLTFINGHLSEIKYDTIDICSIDWSTKNLDVVTYANGDSIPNITDSTEWANITIGAWCYYNNDPANGEIYGKLYNWYAINDPRGLAPIGWHIPDIYEWFALGNCYGGLDIAGGVLVENNFSALYAGLREIGGFSSLGFVTSWWASNELSEIYGYAFMIEFYNEEVLSSTNYLKNTGLSVRCVKN